jgi:uncharacterized membrane protein (UPF0127 family)
MKQHSWLYATLASLLLLAGALRALEAPPVTLMTALISGQAFELELAVTPEARERGLMERLDLPPDGGMLFAFPDEARRRFWMKNTRLDLDIVYLDSAARVVSTASMCVEPPQAERETDAQYEARLPLYPSTAPARFAIEFRSGTLALLHLAPGDQVCLDLARLAALAR